MSNHRIITQSLQDPNMDGAHPMVALTVGGEEEVGSVLLRQPSNLIDLLLDLQTLKVVKLGFMALESAVDIVLSLGEKLRFALRKEKEGIVRWCGGIFLLFTKSV